MSVEVRLLGPPSVRVATDERRIDGHKTWVLLAYLLLEPPVSRRHLAGLLWAEAADPLRAERWAIHNLRRAIKPEAIEDRRGTILVSPSTTFEVDILSVLSGNLDPRGAERIRSTALLEGVEVDASLAAAEWLALQRARVRSAVSEAWRTAATRLAASDPTSALHLAGRVLAIDSYDDAAHELVIELHLARDDRAAAEEHARRTERLYREELGVAFTATRHSNLDQVEPPPNPMVARDIAARALIDSSRARGANGDYLGALDGATRAIDDAKASGIPGLEAEALLALATPLIHGLRGRDREAVGVLDRARRLADQAGDLRLQAQIELERGYLHFLAADYGAAEVTLNRSRRLAIDTDNEIGAAQAAVLLAGCRSDQGDQGTALALLDEGIATLERRGAEGLEAYARTYRARTYLHAGRYADASAEGTRAIELARSRGRMGLVPWPMTVKAEAELRSGNTAAARTRFGEAFTLACDIADPCWEALAERGLAIVCLSEGRVEDARAALEDALARARRLSDTYAWAEALILTELIELDPAGDPALLADATRLVVRGSMRDLAARLHRSTGQTLGQTDSP